MNDTVARLQRTFISLTRRDIPAYRWPVFFFEEKLVLNGSKLLRGTAVADIPMPFEDMWLSCLIEHSGKEYLFYFLLSRSVDRLHTAMIHHTDEGEDIEFIEVYGDSVVKGERRTEIANEAWSIAQTLIMHHLTTLKAPTTERVEGIAEGVIRNPHTRRAREARRARFITVRPNAITPRTEHQGGAHASPVGHERRGHWRTYKTGKRTWVSAMSVNGGAVEGETRNYRVLAATGMVDDSFVKLAEGELSG